MNNTILFGPAGNGDTFRSQYKHTIDVPAYLHQIGLNAYEYQCGRGVKIGQQAAEAFGREAKDKGIALSIHAPYYISLSSVEEQKRKNSIRYILDTARAAAFMGATRIVIHAGSCAKLSRAEALSFARQTLAQAQQEMDQEGFGEIHLCPETMGKINQLGDLGEVIALCQVDERMIPCIDFGHLNARTLGGSNSTEAYEAILSRIRKDLGTERYQNFHVHFSKIEYTSGGEKRHLTFEDTVYGPDFEPLMAVLATHGVTPTMICESSGTQAEDALAMKRCYEELTSSEREAAAATAVNQ